MEDRALPLYIRAKLENGHLLPHEDVSHVWGGQGTVQFHVKCFYVWATEREALSANREPR